MRYEPNHLKPRNHMESYVDAIGLFGKRIQAQIELEAQQKREAEAAKAAANKKGWFVRLLEGLFGTKAQPEPQETPEQRRYREKLAYAERFVITPTKMTDEVRGRLRL
jgi:hypothetical protein